MVVLAGSRDISASFGGSITSIMEEPGNRRLRKLWKQQVTRITAVHRFASKYRAKTLQCGIAPAAPPQRMSKVVKRLLEKSNTSEGSKRRNLSTEALNSGTLFSPNLPAVQDAPKSKGKLGTSKKKNGEVFPFKMGDVVKDHRALYTIVLTLLAFKILEEADLDEVGLIIVTLIALDARQEGTTATYNPVGRTVLRGLLLFVWLSTFEKSGVNAQNDSEDGNLERPSEKVDLLYYVQAAAWTFAGILIVYIAGRINRRPLVPAPAAPALALPPAAAPPAVPVPANPIGAVAPPAVPVPENPIGAVAPPAVPVLANPIGVVAPPAVPVLANPIFAVAPPAVPVPANPIGFVNVREVLEDNPAAARKSNLDFEILPPLD